MSNQSWHFSNIPRDRNVTRSRLLLIFKYECMDRNSPGKNTRVSHPFYINKALCTTCFFGLGVVRAFPFFTHAQERSGARDLYDTHQHIRTASYLKHHITLTLAHTLFISPWLTSPLFPPRRLKTVSSVVLFLTFLFHSLHIPSPSSCPFSLSPLRYMALSEIILHPCKRH